MADKTARRLTVFVMTAALTAACADSVVVDTGEIPSHSPTSVSAPPTGRTDPNLVNAHDYYASTDDVEGYYFTTPSGKWGCAILPRRKAGCQAAGAQSIGVSGGPATVDGPNGKSIAPNAIAVGDDGDPGFVWVEAPGYLLKSGKPMVLDFNKTLAAAGFRCNVQDAGVSCENESTQQGFTFSASGFVPRYSPVLG